MNTRSTPQRASRSSAAGGSSSSSASSSGQEEAKREEEKLQAHADRQDESPAPADAAVREVIEEARTNPALPPAPKEAHANHVLPPAPMVIAQFADVPSPDAERWRLLTDCDPELDIESIGCHARSDPQQRGHLLKLISDARGREADASVIKELVEEYYKVHLTPHATRAAAVAFLGVSLCAEGGRSKPVSALATSLAAANVPVATPDLLRFWCSRAKAVADGGDADADDGEELHVPDWARVAAPAMAQVAASVPGPASPAEGRLAPARSGDEQPCLAPAHGGVEQPRMAPAGKGDEQPAPRTRNGPAPPPATPATSVHGQMDQFVNVLVAALKEASASGPASAKSPAERKTSKTPVAAVPGTGGGLHRQRAVP
jgi:hypothetical protein